jgi:hypothetical protein
LSAASCAFLTPCPQKPPQIDSELETISAIPSANRPYASNNIVPAHCLASLLSAARKLSNTLSVPAHHQPDSPPAAPIQHPNLSKVAPQTSIPKAISDKISG